MIHERSSFMSNFLLRIYVRRSRNGGPFIFIVLFLLSAILLIISLVTVIRYFRYRREIVGRVTDVEISAGKHGRRDRLIVEYECDGTVYNVCSFYTYPLPKYEIGDRIPVRVSKKHPENAMLPYDLEQAVTASILSGGVLILGAVFLLAAALLTND
ncbi:MAG: DUF3592 domain-containing protein [Ruminococcaceae bacterium]|nr:DUF3592 domain-containing protein [Oscillospiraceae bacterium]